MSKFFLCTFGCRCNQADSAAMRDGLSRLSMSESKNHCDADLIIVNSCTVTHRSDQQVRQTVRRMHRDNPNAKIVVAGCYAERDPEALASISGVSLVVGNAEKQRLSEHIAALGSGGGSGAEIVHSLLEEDCDYLLPPMARTGGKTRPVVKIQDGCDARCAYCIVPKVRGPERSADPENVLAEMRSLVESGFQEIVLTGVHLGSYGRKHKSKIRLVDLLRSILEIPGLGRIRLSSIEPMWFDPVLIRLAAESAVFSRHFHIPIQSGCERILRLMRRPYAVGTIRELLDQINKEMPEAGLGTDVLVGFPGETEQDFSKTMSFIKESPLTYLHVFPFSPREGTEAYSMSDRVPAPVVKERMSALLQISRKKNLEFRQRFQGTKLQAITLSEDEDLGLSRVLTGNYIQARVKNLDVPPNRLIDIVITDVQPNSTTAILA
jgi:threonylcarbamoyladenosine tRNA methylthiotransferase MtaB